MEQIRVARVCFGAGAVMAAVGGVMHGSAYGHVVQALGAAHLAAPMVETFEAVWLCFSAILLILAAMLTVLAARPGAASRTIAWLLALIPAASAGIIYRFLGGFIAGHILVAVAVLTFFGGLMAARAPGLSAAKEKAQALSN